MSPLLCAVVMNVVSSEGRSGLLSELLYTDDIVHMAPTMEQLGRRGEKMIAGKECRQTLFSAVCIKWIHKRCSGVRGDLWFQRSRPTRGGTVRRHKIACKSRSTIILTVCCSSQRVFCLGSVRSG